MSCSYKITFIRQYSELTEEARTRVFQHALHEETVFTQRISLFFLAHSVLLASFSELPNKLPAYSSFSLICIGFIYCLVWLIVNHRQVCHLADAVERARIVCPEFPKTDQGRRCPRLSKLTLRMLAYLMPLLTLAVWVILLSGC